MLPGKKGTYRTKVVKVLYSILRALILSLDWNAVIESVRCCVPRQIYLHKGRDLMVNYSIEGSLQK